MKSLLLVLLLAGCARPPGYVPPPMPAFVPQTYTPMAVQPMQNNQLKTTTCQNVGNGQVICTTQ